MSGPAPSREALEDLWRDRLQESQRRYQIAKSICANAAQECANRLMPSADGHFALQRALKLETAALEEYKHALAVFTDLTVNRKLPPAEE
jgi:hypothetical protein